MSRVCGDRRRRAQSELALTSGSEILTGPQFALFCIVGHTEGTEGGHAGVRVNQATEVHTRPASTGPAMRPRRPSAIAPPILVILSRPACPTS